MMIVNVNNIRLMLPGSYPIENGYLEGSETFCVIIVSIYFFAVEKSVDVEKIKIEAEYVGAFLDHCKLKPPVAKIGVSFMYNVPIMIVKKLCAVHRHHKLRHMSRLIQIERKCSGNIS